MTVIAWEFSESTEARDAPPSARLLEEADLPFLFNELVVKDAVWEWRFRGTRPPAEQFHAALMSGSIETLCLLVGGEVAGVTQLVSYSPLDQTAELSIFILPAFRGRAESMVSVGRAVLSLIGTVPLRRVTASCTTESLNALGPLEVIGLEQVGRLPDHIIYRGRPQDLILFSATVDDVEEGVQRALAEWERVRQLRPEVEASGGRVSPNDLRARLATVLAVEPEVLDPERAPLLDARLAHVGELDSLTMLEIHEILVEARPALAEETILGLEGPADAARLLNALIG